MDVDTLLPDIAREQLGRSLTAANTKQHNVSIQYNTGSEWYVRTYLIAYATCHCLSTVAFNAVYTNDHMHPTVT